ncbi:MAG: M16 family metallopeptidase, partial [Planctomycetota bacterium]
MILTRKHWWLANPSLAFAAMMAFCLVGSPWGVSTSSALAEENSGVTAREGKAAATSAKKITTVEGITEYALDNGLQVLLFPDQSKPTVTVNVTYKVGSRHEGRGEAGMAHLLEHMVFKGTPTYENIWGVLQDHGAYFNGSTWVDRTNYFEILTASDENLDFAL